MFSTPMILSIVHLNCRSVSFIPARLGSHPSQPLGRLLRSVQRRSADKSHSFLCFQCLSFPLLVLVFFFPAVTPACHMYVPVLNVRRGGRLRTDAGVQSLLLTTPVLPLWSTSNCIFLQETTVGWKQVALEMNCNLKCTEGTRRNSVAVFKLLSSSSYTTQKLWVFSQFYGAQILIYSIYRYIHNQGFSEKWLLYSFFFFFFFNLQL